MNYLKKASLILISTLLIGCACAEKQSTYCDSSNTEFNQLYNYVLSMPTNQDLIAGHVELHSYSFEVTMPKKICSIGYQSIPGMETTAYHIELYDDTNSMVIYSGDHTFSSVTTSYVSIGSIPLIVGHSYTIKRIQSNWGSTIENTVGRVARGQIANINFPITAGALKIRGPHFGFGFGAALPYIDIVFEE
jgi:hypothetical protein